MPNIDGSVVVLVAGSTEASGESTRFEIPARPDVGRQVNIVCTLSAGTAEIDFVAGHKGEPLQVIKSVTLDTDGAILDVENCGFHVFGVDWSSLSGGGTLRVTAGFLGQE